MYQFTFLPTVHMVLQGWGVILLSSQGNLAISGNIFGGHKWECGEGGLSATSILWVEIRDAAKHPIGQPPTINNCVTQSFKSAVVEKHCFMRALFVCLLLF